MRLWPKAQPLGYYRDVFQPAGYFARTFDSPRVPIFIYHDIEPAEFERHLKFLASNDYRTVTCAELVDIGSPDRNVVLSFDDGRRSVWSVAYPLLKRYGFRATAFISPGIVPDTGIRPTLSDIDLADLAVSSYGNAELFSWEEAALMYRSGVIDMQLHGFAHTRIFVSNRIVTFENPNRSDHNENVSAWQLERDDGEVLVHRFAPGAPIYEWGSRWGRRQRYFDDPGLARACSNHVNRHAGPQSFFEQRDWRAQLTNVVTAYRAERGDCGRFESVDGKRRNLLKLLSNAKQQLQHRLGIRAEHFALPWAEGDPILVGKVAAEVGIKHIYWAYQSRQQAAMLPQSPLGHHPRIKDIFLLRLPGRGRENVAKLLVGEYFRIRQARQAVRA